jgi:hypothetical protein
MKFNLKEVTLTEAERKRMMPAIEGSWINVHAATVDTPNTVHGMNTLLKWIKCEKEYGKNRPQILHRLYRKAAAIRMAIEEHELHA